MFLEKIRRIKNDFKEEIIRECCEEKSDIFDLLIQAVGRKEMLSIQGTFLKQNGMRGEFNKDQFEDRQDELAFLARWLIDFQEKKSLPALPGNLGQALGLAQLWLEAKDTKGDDISVRTGQLYSNIFGERLVSHRLESVVCEGETVVDVHYGRATDHIVRNHTCYQTAEEFALAHVRGLSGRFTIKLLPTGENLADEIRIEIDSDTLKSNTDYLLDEQKIKVDGSENKKKIPGLFKAFYRNRIQLCFALGIEKIHLEADSIGCYAWLRYGFVPYQDQWNEIRYRELWDRLEGNRDNLSAKTFKIIEGALYSDDPRSAWIIADLREEVFERKIGFLMFEDLNWHGAIDMIDPKSLTRCKQYIGFQDTRKPKRVAAYTT